MTKNQKRKYISLTLLILSILALIILALARLVYHKSYDFWQYLAAPLCIAFFAVMYRNFSQAVKEDDKYGPVE